MAELETINVGHIVRDMLGQTVDFVPGPMTGCSRRMALVVMGAPVADPAHWACRRFAEVEALHQVCVARQVFDYIHNVLWLRFTDLGVADLSRGLHLWSSALVAASTMVKGVVPGVQARALYAVQVAAYLGEHNLPEPVKVDVKLMEVPKQGQPSLGQGGAPLIMERKLVITGEFPVNEPEREQGRGGRVLRQ